MEIYIIKLFKKDFERLVGDKRSTGYAYHIYKKEVKHKPKYYLFVKDLKNKKVIKKTIEHELSHFFIHNKELNKKINQREFKKVLKDKNFRDYEKDIYTTKIKIREEFLADLISYSVFGSKYERNYIKGKYPKNYNIIKNEWKKFKYKLIYI